MSEASALRQLCEFHEFAVDLLGFATVGGVADTLRRHRQGRVPHTLGIAREAPRHRAHFVGLSPGVGVLEIVDTHGERQEKLVEIPSQVRVVRPGREQGPQRFGLVHAHAYRLIQRRAKRHPGQLRCLQSCSSFRA